MRDLMRRSYRTRLPSIAAAAAAVALLAACGSVSRRVPGSNIELPEAPAAKVVRHLVGDCTPGQGGAAPGRGARRDACRRVAAGADTVVATPPSRGPTP